MTRSCRITVGLTCLMASITLAGSEQKWKLMSACVASVRRIASPTIAWSSTSSTEMGCFFDSAATTELKSCDWHSATISEVLRVGMRLSCLMSGGKNTCQFWRNTLNRQNVHRGSQRGGGFGHAVNRAGGLVLGYGVVAFIA